MNDKLKTFSLDNTRFIFKTNFEGDPDRDNFGSNARKGSVIINDILTARALIDMGAKVKQTKPKPGYEEDFVPEYFAEVKIKYRDKRGNELRFLPKVYLITEDGERVPLDESTVGMIDNISVKRVRGVFNVYEDDVGRISLYVRVLYVEQRESDDPFASDYARRNEDDQFAADYE